MGKGGLHLLEKPNVSENLDWDLEQAALAPFRSSTATIEFHEGTPLDEHDLKVRDAIVISFDDPRDLSPVVVILRPERYVGDTTSAYADAVSIVSSLEEMGVSQDQIIKELIRLGEVHGSLSTIENRENIEAILPSIGVTNEQAEEEVPSPLKHFLMLKENLEEKEPRFTCENVSLDKVCEDNGKGIAISTVTGSEPLDENRISLDQFCQHHFRGDFCDVSLFSKHGHLRSDLDGNVLTTQIPWFSGIVTDINRVQKHLIDVVASPSGLLALDPDHTDFLPSSMERLTSPSHCSSRVASSGGTILHFFDQAIRRSDKILDLLDDRVEEISKRAHNRRLTPQELSNEVDLLKRSLRYFGRKTKEMSSHTLGILSEAFDEDPTFFNEKDPTHKLQQLENKVLRLVERAEESLTQLKEVETTFDRLEKANTDFTIKLFTVFVGYTAPPIIADLACRFFLGHEDPRLMIAAIGVAIAAHIGTYFYKWRRKP